MQNKFVKNHIYGYKFSDAKKRSDEVQGRTKSTSET